jgi:hypothetical protein
MNLRIIRKHMDLDHSRLLYDRPIQPDTLETDYRIYGGRWGVVDGWLTGQNPLNAPGMVFLKGDYPGNVLVDFEARTVLPCTHDIDVMWNGSWDEAKNARGLAYVAGLQGWWEGKVGIEKSPEYLLNAATPLFPFQPGQVYHIQAGSIDGHCFVFADGKLLLEVTDPDPIDNQKYTQIGFEAYCSHIQIRNVKVWQLAWQPVEMHYDPEF